MDKESKRLNFENKANNKVGKIINQINGLQNFAYE